MIYPFIYALILDPSNHPMCDQNRRSTPSPVHQPCTKIGSLCAPTRSSIPTIIFPQHKLTSIHFFCLSPLSVASLFPSPTYPSPFPFCLTMPVPATYTGTFIHTPSLGKLVVLENKKVSVDGRGVIIAIEDLDDEEVEKETVEKGRLRWWFPGFVGKDWLLFFFFFFVVDRLYILRFTLACIFRCDFCV